MTTSIWQLPIEDSLQTAWKRIHGIKHIFWKALIVSIFVMGAYQLAVSLLYPFFPRLGSISAPVLQLIAFLLQMGFIYMGVQRGLEIPFTWHAVFKGFQGFMPIHLISLYLLQFCIVLIPITLMVISTIWYQSQHSILHLLGLVTFILGFLIIYFLFIRMMMSAAIVMDQDETPWEAIKQSFHLTRGNVLRLLALTILLYGIMVVSVFTIVGVIWSFPFSFTLYGTIYRELKEHRGLPATSVKL